MHTQEGDKHFYQKVQACYSVTSTVEKGKTINYTVKLNPIFCYKVFQQNYFYEPFLNLKFKNFLEKQKSDIKFTSKTFYILFLLTYELSQNNNYFVKSEKVSLKRKDEKKGYANNLIFSLKFLKATNFIYDYYLKNLDIEFKTLYEPESIFNAIIKSINNSRILNQMFKEPNK